MFHLYSLFLEKSDTNYPPTQTTNTVHTPVGILREYHCKRNTFEAKSIDFSFNVIPNRLQTVGLLRTYTRGLEAQSGKNSNSKRHRESILRPFHESRKNTPDPRHGLVPNLRSLPTNDSSKTSRQANADNKSNIPFQRERSHHECILKKEKSPGRCSSTGYNREKIYGR